MSFTIFKNNLELKNKSNNNNNNNKKEKLIYHDL